MKRGLIQWNKNVVPIEEFEFRIGKTKKTMESRGVDVLAIYGDACQANNLTYLTNFFPYADTGIFVLPLAETPKLFTTHAYRNIPWFNTITWVKDIVCTDHIGEESAEYLKTLDLAGKKTGLVNTRSFPFPIYSVFQKGLACDFIDFTKDFEKIRMVKTKVEKEFTTQAAHIAASSFERVRKAFRQGISGYELAAEVELNSRKKGAEDVLFLIQPDCSPCGLSLPTPDPIEKMCSLEISVEYQGCWAKLGRTLFLEEASQEYEARLGELSRGFCVAVKNLRAGSPFSSLAAELRNQCALSGGNGSLEVYFDPGLEPYWGIHQKAEGVFQNDMIFHVRVVLKSEAGLQMAMSDTYLFENSAASLMFERP